MEPQIVEVFTNQLGENTVTVLLIDEKFPNGQIELVKEFASGTDASAIMAAFATTAALVNQIYDA